MLKICKLAGALSLLCSLLVAVSCEKVEHSFFFSSEGGPYDFEAEFDGASLKVVTDDGSSKDAIFYGNEADMEHSNWVADLDWIRVSYLPTRRHVYVSVKKNETGKERKARVTAIKNGRQVVLAEFKQQ